MKIEVKKKAVVSEVAGYKMLPVKPLLHTKLKVAASKRGISIGDFVEQMWESFNAIQK